MGGGARGGSAGTAGPVLFSEGPSYGPLVGSFYKVLRENGNLDILKNS